MHDEVKPLNKLPLFSGEVVIEYVYERSSGLSIEDGDYIFMLYSSSILAHF